ncbi:UPF0481 protein At3g47200-like [Prunus avium]|uniref:UPF0481 protein At3g47200-like n=1 Tax=Prunus avium TaxID=42229 RepID=A0A6P5S2D6_PRUAV|nr:UPF0481 protein At3g47200-like [Prunus avium]
MGKKKMQESSNEAPVDIESQATSMQNQLTNLRALPPACCIYRVPERLRNVKKKAYTPQVVSIGPLHHGSKNLEAMEDHKLRYLNCFLARTEVGLKTYFKKIEEKEDELRRYYEDTKKFNTAAFLNIILVDAAFVIELLLRNKSEEKLRDDNAWIFKKPWVLQNILPDMLMLENQLPFFILEDLYSLTGAQTGVPSIIQLSYKFFQQALRLEEDLEKRPAFREYFMSRDSEPSHFVDFIRTLHLLDFNTPKPGGPLNSTREGNGGLRSTPSVTKLHQAGVKFHKNGSRKNLFDIEFNKDTVEIPKIEIHDYTELTLRNLIAFEQCHCVDKYISDYVFILDKFVNTPKDVELLVENGIVVNTLGDNNKVSVMINKLCSKVAPNHGNYYFGTLAEGLNKYYDKPTNKWKANWRQKYFNTPWAAISLIAAVILLILTVIQTVCSIISVIDYVLAVSLSVVIFFLCFFCVFCVLFCFQVCKRVDQG